MLDKLNEKNNNCNIQTDSEINTTEEEQEQEKIISYYRANRTEILNQKKGYYQNKKGYLLNKVVCECGREVVQASLTRHKKSKLHKSYIDNLKKSNNNEVVF